MDRWTASTTGSVRKGFEFGMESSAASAAEVKGSEWAGGGGRRGTERLWWREGREKEKLTKK